MMNQIHRHRAAEALHALERLADAESILNSPEEVTSTHLKKVDPRKKLRKWGVMSLQKYVKRNQEARLTHPEWARKERERVDTTYKEQITALEQDSASPRAQKFLREINASAWHLNLFLKRNPKWKPRLEHQLSELRRSEAKARLKTGNQECAETTRRSSARHVFDADKSTLTFAGISLSSFQTVHAMAAGDSAHSNACLAKSAGYRRGDLWRARGIAVNAERLRINGDFAPVACNHYPSLGDA